MDKTTCEIKRCSELKVDECNRLNYQNDENNICVPKKDNSGCEIKMCKELTADRCHLATIENFMWKCVKENDKCVQKWKFWNATYLLFRRSRMSFKQRQK